MTWEQKTEMCRLGNAYNLAAEEDKFLLSKDFKNYVAEFLDVFDSQAWDMFFTILTINPKEVALDLEFYGKIVNKVKKFDDKTNAAFGMNTAFRIEIFLQIYEEELADSKKA